MTRNSLKTVQKVIPIFGLSAKPLGASAIVAWLEVLSRSKCDDVPAALSLPTLLQLQQLSCCSRPQGP